MDTRIQRIRRSLQRPTFTESSIDVDLKSLNTLDFQKQKQKFLKKLISGDTINLDKYKIISYFCDKLFTIFRMSEKIEKIMIDELYKLVKFDTSFSTAVKLYYMRFRNEKVSLNSSIKLYENNIRENLATIPYFQILKFILKNSYTSKTIISRILDEFNNLFVDETISLFVKMEIADIFLLNGREERGNQMLGEIRGQENILHLESKTIYDDTQNVHNVNINQSVLKVAYNLLDIYGKTELKLEDVLEELTDISPEYKPIFKQVLERVDIDTSRFKYEKTFFSMYLIFANIWEFIQRHKLKEDLMKRLIEEIIEMEKYCSTGHISRFVNVIQGYTDNELLCVRISSESQIKSIIFNKIEKLLLKAPEKVLDSIIEQDNSLFLNYVCRGINNQMSNLLKEYGNVENEILAAIKNYTKTEKIIIKNKQFFLK